MTRMVWMLWLVVCCTGPTPASEYKAAAPAATDATVTPLRFIEHVTGGASADETLPMVVAIHGLGDRPENFVGLFSSWSVPTRVIVPAGSTPWGNGHAWMTVRTAEESRREVLAQQTRASAEMVAALIRQVLDTRPTKGKPVVTGFSQGGMVSFALAAHHGTLIQGAVPLAGYYPKPDQLAGTTRIAPVRALHGDADAILPLELAQETVEAFKSTGADATLTVYPGVRHSVSAAMRADLFKHLKQLGDAE